MDQLAFHRESRGFTLLEAMVGLGVAAIGGLAILSMIQVSMKGQKGVQNSLDFDLMSSTINLILQNPATACQGVFQNASNQKVVFNQLSNPPPNPLPVPTPVTVDHISLGNSMIAQGNQLLNGGLKMLPIVLAPVTSIPMDTISYQGKAYNRFFVMMTLAAQKTAAYGGSDLKRAFAFTVETDQTSGTIEYCNLPGAQPMDTIIKENDQIQPGGTDGIPNRDQDLHFTIGPGEKKIFEFSLQMESNLSPPVDVGLEGPAGVDIVYHIERFGSSGYEYDVEDATGGGPSKVTVYRNVSDGFFWDDGAGNPANALLSTGNYRKMPYGAASFYTLVKVYGSVMGRNRITKVPLAAPGTIYLHWGKDGNHPNAFLNVHQGSYLSVIQSSH